MSKIREKESLECVRMHIWASKTQKLPGPLSGPWTPAAECSLRSRDSTSLCRQLSASEAGAPPLTKSWIRTCDDHPPCYQGFRWPPTMLPRFPQVKYIHTSIIMEVCKHYILNEEVVLQWSPPDVTSRGYVPRSDVWGKGCTLPCDLTHDAFDVISEVKLMHIYAQWRI